MCVRVCALADVLGRDGVGVGDCVRGFPLPICLWCFLFVYRGQVIDLMEHVLTPTIRVGVFREMKRVALDHMRDAPDKYPNRLTWQEFVAFMAGCRCV
jgi:hypothetical protein